MSRFRANSLYTDAALGTVTEPTVAAMAGSETGSTAPEHPASWFTLIPATSRKSASHCSTLNWRCITVRSSSAMVSTLRLPEGWGVSVQPPERDACA